MSKCMLCLYLCLIFQILNLSLVLSVRDRRCNDIVQAVASQETTTSNGNYISWGSDFFGINIPVAIESTTMNVNQSNWCSMSEGTTFQTMCACDTDGECNAHLYVYDDCSCTYDSETMMMQLTSNTTSSMLYSCGDSGGDNEGNEGGDWALVEIRTFTPEAFERLFANASLTNDSMLVTQNCDYNVTCMNYDAETGVEYFRIPVRLGVTIPLVVGEDYSDDDSDLSDIDVDIRFYAQEQTCRGTDTECDMYNKVIGTIALTGIGNYTVTNQDAPFLKFDDDGMPENVTTLEQLVVEDMCDAVFLYMDPENPDGYSAISITVVSSTITVDCTDIKPSPGPTSTPPPSNPGTDDAPTTTIVVAAFISLVFLFINH